MRNAFTLDELALIFKAKELEAIKRKRAAEPWLKDCSAREDGMAEAFSEVWRIIVFRGKGLSPPEYNKHNKKWIERVHKESPLELLEGGGK